MVEFLNFWLYGFSFIALVTLLDPFVQIWAGGRFVLGLPISIAIAINFFVAGYMNTLWVFRSTLGLFKQGKFRPILVAILNISSATTVLRFAVMTMVTAIVPNAIFWLAYRRCEEYAYFRSIVKDHVIAPVRGKLH